MVSAIAPVGFAVASASVTACGTERTDASAGADVCCARGCETSARPSERSALPSCRCSVRGRRYRRASAGRWFNPRGVSPKGESAARSGWVDSRGHSRDVIRRGRTQRDWRQPRRSKRRSLSSKKTHFRNEGYINATRIHVHFAGSPAALRKCAPRHAAPHLRRAPSALGTRARIRTGCCLLYTSPSPRDA